MLLVIKLRTCKNNRKTDPQNTKKKKTKKIVYKLGNLVTKLHSLWSKFLF
jgi:hypothetical protein